MVVWTGRPSVETAHPQRLESSEVAVVGENSVDAVLPAQRGNLRIEHQVSTSIRLACGLEEELEKVRARLDEEPVRNYVFEAIA